MYFPGRSAGVHLAALVRVLQHHPEHGELLSGVLPAADDERVRQVG